ncbi:RNA polymerase sigma factor [Pontiella agarivorans]|uniref:Sigma-70 family RNA polymerase sigma factor n=1 Tax=Pontiella agarivorans TaxID=3038953 RepID=A0ABU5MVR2_9BACT|nr:sigma-70 family RNA polymerase sigma factor [Pontiella agarivorans]MDZ8118285.1 sigma-70 family RNA polymerase sigma factor [Pontiella agarivorans]
MVDDVNPKPENIPDDKEAFAEAKDISAEEIPAAEEGPSDVELVLKAQHGDVHAFDQLVERYHAKIYGLTYNMTSNREDAEDLTQEVFVKAYEALPRFKGKSSFYTWVYRIAVNKTINYRKKRNRKRALSLDSFEQEIKLDDAYHEMTAKGSPLRNISLSELQKKLNEALQNLSEKHRTVVVMHDMQGIPHEEIAKVVGASVGTVRSRLFYARRQMQTELAEFMK